MGMQPRDAKIVFVLTQALSERRLNLAMETEKYVNIFGSSFLKSSIVLGTNVDKLDGDEIGLVLFSGASFIQFPLTSDYDTARSFLDNARPESISRPGTEIGDAIRTAMSGFDDQRESQKVMVIVKIC